MKIKYVNPKLKQSAIAREINCPTSTFDRYRHDINKLLPYRIPLISQKRRQKISNTKFKVDSHREHDLKRHQMISNDIKRPQRIELAKPVSNADSAVNRTTNKGSRLEKSGIIEIIGGYLGDIFSYC